MRNSITIEEIQPFLNTEELEQLDKLSAKYEKLISPGALAKAGTKIGELIPIPIKEFGSSVKGKITEQELFAQTMKILAEGFGVIESYAAKYSISEEKVIEKINGDKSKIQIDSLDEICLLRSYDVAKVVNSNKRMEILAAGIEGATTGAAGFPGLPFSIVLSTFLYFRAVQTIAMFYGYDVKNNSDEMVVANGVFVASLSPSNDDVNNEITNMIAKIMAISHAEVVKQTSQKTWVDMASRGGVPLLVTQMRALAHKSAKKALEASGKKGLENSLFRDTFEQIGRRLTLKATGKAVPVVSAGIGALLDVAQMNKVIEYADVFYHKRFIAEKEQRIRLLFSQESEGTIIEEA